jgi:predicted dehydrogenase
MAKACLLAGKHTFIEKPMAASLAECEELVAIAEEKGLVLMVGHTFLYSPVVRKIKEIVDSGDLGEIRYIAARRLNLGLYQKDINVAWDLAPHDISIILHIMEELPQTVNCRGEAHITPGIEDVTSMCLSFRKNRSAIIHNSWLDPRKIREMTIVGSRRMLVYDDVQQLETGVSSSYALSVRLTTTLSLSSSMLTTMETCMFHTSNRKNLKAECGISWTASGRKSFR